MTTALELEAIETPQESDMGPAVLPGFEEVAGLEQLVRDTPKRARTEGEQKPVTPLQPSAEVVSVTQIQTLLSQVDTVTSAVLDVPAVPSEALTDTAKGIQPLANYYATQQPTVTTLYILAILSLISYAGLKFAQVRMKGKLNAQDKATAE